MSMRSRCGIFGLWWRAPMLPTTTKAGPWPPACGKPLTGAVDGLRQQWTGEIAKHLDENRVVRALRLAARPPEPSARMDAELTQRLSDAAGEAMGSDTPADRWLALIDAVSASPVRRSVKPAGLPADPTPELRRAAHQQSGRIPALAAMLGVAIPPPPTPLPGRRRGTAARDPWPATATDDAGTADVALPAGAPVADEAGVSGPGPAEGAPVADEAGASEPVPAEGAPVADEAGASEPVPAEGTLLATDEAGMPDISRAEGAPSTADDAGAADVESAERAPAATDDAGAPALESPEGWAVATGASGEDAQDPVVAQELDEPIHEG